MCKLIAFNFFQNYNNLFLHYFQSGIMMKKIIIIQKKIECNQCAHCTYFVIFLGIGQGTVFYQFMLPRRSPTDNLDNIEEPNWEADYASEGSDYPYKFQILYLKFHAMYPHFRLILLLLTLSLMFLTCCFTSHRAKWSIYPRL